MKATTKTTSVVCLEMTQEEAAYLHAFLGHFSPNDFIAAVKTEMKDNDDTTFLPKGFNVDLFDRKLRDDCDGFYSVLNAELENLHTQGN